MERETVLAVGLAVLALGALGIAAATIDDAVVSDDSPFGGSGDPGTDRGPDPAEQPEAESGDPIDVDDYQLNPCIPELSEPPVVIALLLAIVGLFAVMYRGIRSLLVSAIVTVGLSAPVVVVWAAFAFCASVSDAGEQTEDLVVNASEFAPDRVGEGGSVGGSVSPTLALLFVLFAAIIGALALLVVASGDDSDDGQPTEPEADADDEIDLGSIRRAAGAAADRIEEDADVDNEVFRAWREMTTYLDVDRPETSTPTEFAEAAVEAGFDPDDVGQLTDVFEAVRYGGADADTEREERAVKALRRIEEGRNDG